MAENRHIPSKFQSRDSVASLAFLPAMKARVASASSAGVARALSATASASSKALPFATRKGNARSKSGAHGGRGALAHLLLETLGLQLLFRGILGTFARQGRWHICSRKSPAHLLQIFIDSPAQPTAARADFVVSFDQSVFNRW